MPEGLLFSHVSPPRRALIRLCQSINYGRIERLHIRNAEPADEPPPMVLKDLKLDCEQQLRREHEVADFVLQIELCRLLEHLDNLQDGIIDRLDVIAGVPRRVLTQVCGTNFVPMINTSPQMSSVECIPGAMPDVKEEHVEAV